ncbi:MAG TPA: hypothetical protein VHI78_05130 [Bacteroidales bacterium]|nr:hypothetical protein [Bacteroidales bacterium]
MKKLFLLIGVLLSSALYCTGQQPTGGSSVNRENLTLRPNSRDYNIIRLGNNHQRIVQLRSQAMMRHKQALMNRKMAMERRQALIRRQMMRQQNIHQRMVRQRGHHK